MDVTISTYEPKLEQLDWSSLVLVVLQLKGLK